MYEKPENTSGGEDQSRPEIPRSGLTPPGGTDGSYNPSPAPADTSAWQPGQFSYSDPGTTNLSGETQPVPTPPSYSQAPAQQQALPQYGYNYPQQQGQGQPTQYAQPTQYGQQPGAPPVYSPGQPLANPPGTYNAYPQQPAFGYTQPKDPSVAMMLEFIGWLGFLGIGHIYAGKTTRGVGLLVGWLVYNLVLVTVILPIVTLGSVMTCGIGCLLFIPLIGIWVGVPLGSGIWLRNETTREQMAAGFRR